MRKKIIPSIAMLLAAALCVGAIFVANPVPKYNVNDYGTPVVMAVNDDEIHANEYAMFFQANKANMENQYAMFGLDTSTLWTDPETKDQMLQSLRDTTEQMLVQYHIILQEFQTAGLSLNKADLTKMKENRQTLLAQYGGEENFETALQQQGLTPEMYDNVMVISTYVNKINDYYFGKDGIYTASDADILAKFHEKYVQAKHILISTVDNSTGEALTGDALAEKKKLAEEALKKAQDGEDFDALIAEYGEDPGMSTYPNGYIFTDGEMVPEFYDGTLALEDNAISGIVTSDYGYHIIKRMPLDESAIDDMDLSQTDTYRNILSSEITGKDFSSTLQEWTDKADVQKTDDELQKIDIDTAYDVAMTGIDVEDASTDSAAPADVASTTDAPADAS